MSPPDNDPGSAAPAARTAPGASPGAGGGRRGLLITLTVGLAIGLLLIGLARRDRAFAGLEDPELGILVNGLDARTGRDVLLPTSGWVLHVVLPEGLPEPVRKTLVITLREERSGTTIDIADRFAMHGDVAGLVMPESVGLVEGLFSIRASLRDEEGRELARHRRVRIRGWLGGPPIGDRQVLHFDFAVDRDGDGRPDFEQDLERLGLVSPQAGALATWVARAVVERALARVRRAYDPSDDPNGTFRERDTVFVRFLLEAEPTPLTTRICVGGANETYPGSVGNVRFDARNAIKGRAECEPTDDAPAAGLFPSELAIYRESPLYREVLGDFDPAFGGSPLGEVPGDTALREPATITPRMRAARRAIDVLGDVLGTIMAHESAHALGLVPPGRPGVGLFGGSARDGADHHHNLTVDGRPSTRPWLMNDGRGFRFEDLAGEGPAGELRFRPLNHAYLKDRLVLVDDPRG